MISSWVWCSFIVRLVHLDGSLVDISMLKPSFNTIDQEEIEERGDLEKEEDDVKQREEEKITESFSCSMTADPEPEQGSGTLESDLMWMHWKKWNDRVIYLKYFFISV